jgi:hypothetical protein
MKKYGIEESDGLFLSLYHRRKLRGFKFVS